MKMKFKTLAAYLTALTVMLGTVAVMAVNVGANDDDEVERPPTINVATQGWRVNDFSARGGNEVAFNDRNTADNEVGSGDLNLIFDGDGYESVTGVRVQFFLDWENTDWGEAEAWDDGEDGESPWANHTISIVTQGICGERANRLPSHVDPTGSAWRQWNFDVVREATEPNQIQYGAESVVVTVPITADEEAVWFRITIITWEDTPGYAVANLLGEEGAVLPISRVVCHLCDRGWTTEACQCPVEETPPPNNGGTQATTPGGTGEVNPPTGIAVTFTALIAAGAASVAILTKKRK
jgi:hypothetical protein